MIRCVQGCFAPDLGSPHTVTGMSLSTLTQSQSILTSQSNDNIGLIFLFSLISCKQNLVVFNLKHWIKKSFPKIWMILLLLFVVPASFCCRALLRSCISDSPQAPSTALGLISGEEVTTLPCVCITAGGNFLTHTEAILISPVREAPLCLQ